MECTRNTHAMLHFQETVSLSSRFTFRIKKEEFIRTAHANRKLRLCLHDTGQIFDGLNNLTGHVVLTELSNLLVMTVLQPSYKPANLQLTYNRVTTD